MRLRITDSRFGERPVKDDRAGGERSDDASPGMASTMLKVPHLRITDSRFGERPVKDDRAGGERSDDASPGMAAMSREVNVLLSPVEGSQAEK